MKKNPAGSDPLISRDTLLAEARLLVSKPSFSHEDASRCAQVLALADRLGSNSHEDRSAQARETRNFANFLRRGTAAEARDMGIATGAGGAYLVAEGFRTDLAETMKAYDALFDPSFVTWYPTPTGAPTAVPAADDSMNAATIISEGQPDSEQDPALQQVALPAPPTFRTGKVTVSHELLQDTAVDVISYLAGIFGKRLARGISPTLVSALAAGVPSTVTASGSSTNTGGTETGGSSIGSDDLFALMATVDPAYLNSEKAAFMMNWPTLLALWKLRSSNGRLVFPPEFDDDGTPMLLGFPVGICPSLPNIGPSAEPIYFGDFSFFLTRVVLNAASITIDRETRAEYGQTVFRSLLRGQGTMLISRTSTTIPIAGLKNAAS